MISGCEGLLGLDAEWDSGAAASGSSAVALLQLSTATECVLVQLGRLQGGVPPSLLRLLADPQVIKAGLGIAEDMRRLQVGFGIAVQGAVDLRDVAGAVPPSLTPASPAAAAASGSSLRSLTQQLLGLQLDKSLQCSAWGDLHLTDAQVTYAAHDAWASRQVLVALIEQQQQQQQQQREQRAAAALPLPSEQGQQHPRPNQAGKSLPASATEVNSSQSHAPAPAPANATPGPHSTSHNGVPDQPPPPALHRLLTRYILAPCNPIIQNSSNTSMSDCPVTDAGGAQAAQRMHSPRQRPPPAPPEQPLAARDRKATRQARLAAAAGAMGSDLLTGRRAPAEGFNPHEFGVSGVALSAPSRGAGGRKKEVRQLGKKPVLYDNCTIQAPDGELLCTCSIKKARWYLSLGLATQIATQPHLQIRLLFEPQGRNASTDAYETAAKSNCCCVCGADDDYGRHAVVPRCYRQHFPLVYKSHMAHDILPMCRRCEQRCSSEDHHRMRAVGLQYGAPLDVAKFSHDEDVGKARSAARALIKSQGRIPPDRQAALMLVLQQHFGAEAVDDDMLQRAAEEDPRIPNSDWSSHAEVVVAALTGPDTIDVFVRGWRQHFLDTMLPSHLPLHWSVASRVCMDHPESCMKHGEGRDGGMTAAGSEVLSGNAAGCEA
ncbi:MAG: hypothetical protein WDW38_000441 [Sanguina aurantia]